MRRPSREDLIVQTLLDAYRRGAFPMADPPSRSREGQIRWYAPDPRAIIPLGDGGLHISRSLRKTLRRGAFTVTADACFERVIRACAEPSPTRGEPWLNETLISAYTLLHERGHAHSMEVWVEEGTGPRAQGRVGKDPSLRPRPSALRPLLVGGIYGVAIGRGFFAESMFSRPELGGTDASKVALATLWNHLRACGYELLDAQIANDHTMSMGVIEVPREEYLGLLAAATRHTDAWKPPGGD